MTELAIDDPAQRSSRSLVARHPVGVLLVDNDSTGAGRPRPHTLVHSIVLHLAPGAAVLAAYAALVPVAGHLHLPSGAALGAAGLVAVAPVQLALLRHHRRARPGEPAVQLRRRLALPRVLAWALLEIVLGALAFLVTAPLVDRLQGVFGWWPAAWAVDLGNHSGYTRSAQLGTAALVLVGTVLMAPIVEEVYFRGYLLPRMPPRLGSAGPLAHATLFACYHLQTPWLTPARILAITPLAYIAAKTRDLRIGIVAHCVLNGVDFIVLVFFIVR
jgi:membrane protease YdiL (CAAX protease family)